MRKLQLKSKLDSRIEPREYRVKLRYLTRLDTSKYNLYLKRVK